MVLIDGLVRMQKCMDFGGASHPGVWGKIADAILEIFRRYGITDVLKWVDDFVFMRYPGKENWYDVKLIWDIAARLGWTWDPGKFFDFAIRYRYIGFLWDLAHQEKP
ncbi:hypothetical protein CYLTODRAFT_481786 [Cylindrobasidium torrendii FP15055 ss-10]|uniref:Reverse transcriptase domain-containing protein n=1 Tax=Cylindrobasidium torrendii FP15055 ss-10 TaxID=1314674 RepID=A0A0D7ASW5_9AGAR|nr:hypothetical protein CYLTODRAFT_481786 [Cylindrobasidium torrendii FP15055 ss-10]